MWLQGGLGTATTNYIGKPADTGSWTQYWPHGEVYFFIRGNNIWHAASFNGRLQQTESYEARGNLNDATNMLLVSCPNWGLNPDGTANWNLYDICPHASPTYDNGNLRGYDEYVGGLASGQALHLSQNFGYDPLNRLQTATEGTNWSRTFHYDQWGNMWLTGNTGLDLNPRPIG